jgi:hypothetical protein
MLPACGSRCARERASSEAEPARGRRGLSSEAETRSREREPSSEAEPARGSVSPRARRALLEGAPCWAALVGCGGHRGVGCAVCVCFVLCSRSVCVLCFFQVLSSPPGFLRTLVAVPDNSLVHLAYQPPTSSTFFSQSPTISQQYFSPTINQHEPPITSQINTFMLSLHSIHCRRDMAPAVLHTQVM